jgi:hypothetical protein
VNIVHPFPDILQSITEGTLVIPVNTLSVIVYDDLDTTIQSYGKINGRGIGVPDDIMQAFLYR